MNIDHVVTTSLPNYIKTIAAPARYSLAKLDNYNYYKNIVYPDFMLTEPLAISSASFFDQIDFISDQSIP